jgi:hypothetical protein
LDDFSVDAAPPISSFASFARFLFRSVTLEFTRLCIRHAHLDNISVDADPALVVTAISPRVLFGRVPMTASLIALRPGHRDDVHAGGCVNTAPTLIWIATRFSFLFRAKTLAVAPLAVFLGEINHFAGVASGHATPAHPTMRRCLFF